MSMVTPFIQQRFWHDHKKQHWFDLYCERGHLNFIPQCPAVAHVTPVSQWRVALVVNDACYELLQEHSTLSAARYLGYKRPTIPNTLFSQPIYLSLLFARGLKPEAELREISQCLLVKLIYWVRPFYM